MCTHATKPLSRLRVWIIEDEPHLRQALGSLCKAWQVQAQFWPDGQALLSDLPGPTWPHIILTDYGLPGMNGIDLISALILEHPGGTTLVPTPIILSGVTNPAALRHIQHSKFRFIPKPFRPEELLAAMTEINERLEDSVG